jgi:Domain of unknown function (DUF1840)
MLYKFKSDAAGDVIMLEASGREVLHIMGKSSDAQGILLPQHMAAALAALKAAIEQAEREAAKPDAPAAQDESNKTTRISLRTRAWPLVLLIERSLQADVPVTWGV